MTGRGTANLKLAKAQWYLLILLIVSIFINYVDRGNLSIAAPIISRELSLSITQLGSLFSAFFWTYALLQLFGIAGWLADRFPVGIVLAAGFFLWSTATILTGVVSGFAALFFTRLLLGTGESIAYPCYSRILASDIPQHHRGIANALIDAGSKLGPALGTFLGGILLAHFGWRMFFIAFGAGSLLWLVPWMFWGTTSCSRRTDECQGGPSVIEILRSRSAWGTFLGHFCGNYFWFFLLTWLPTYLIEERNFSLEQMARISSLAFLAIATATVVAGWMSDRWIRAGASPTRVRKTMVVGGLTLSTAILPVAVVTDVTLSVVFLFLSCMAFGTFTSNHWAITQTLAGPLAAGRWTSLQNGIGNLSGIVASWLTGMLVQQTGSFQLPFVAAAIIVLTGAAMWGMVVGPVKEVRWAQ